MLLGLAMIAVSLAGGEDQQQVAGTTVVTERSALVPDIVPGTTSPVGSSGIGGDWAEPRNGRSALAGFGEVQATITSGTGQVCEVCLLSATTDEQRQRGLMEVTDDELGGYDGMLFEYPTEIQGSFWMRNTPMPLSIAYFDEAGAIVSTTDMVPCADTADCPSYPAADAFRFALEVPRGNLEELAVTGSATIRINARSCTAADGGA